MTTDTNLSQIVFNRLSNEKYHELKTSGQLNDQQFYITPDLDTNPGLIQDYMSNCITKIPQHINLELSTDGTLTLKAGSKVYVPNGVGVFDEVTIQSDFSRDGKIWNGLGIITYQNGIDWAPLTNCVSSDTTPAEPKNGMLWYDTTNNIIKRYNGTDWFGTRSLPLAIFNSSAESTELEIIQVFNGIGYIGAVAFAVPGVQVIIPNGFNSNGQLNNYTATVERVLTKDYAADNILGQNLPLTLTNSPLLSAGDLIYVEEENQIYKGSIAELNKRTEVEIAKVTTDSTRITSLTPLPIYNRILGSYDLTNKANTDLSNVSSNIDYVVESYQNGSSWYRIYKSGWVEQGGVVGTEFDTTATGSNMTISLLKPFSSVNYTVFVTPSTKYSPLAIDQIKIIAKTSTDFTLKNTCSKNWMACGQGAN